MLKSISAAAIPGALKLAREFRKLGHPQMCESICLDVLQAEPANQDALRLTLLASTDQFGADSANHETAARAALRQLTSEYDRAYYDGYILHRSAQSAIAQDSGAAARTVYELLTRAMASFEAAERVRPAGDDNAILMWNSCQRLLQATPHSGPRETQAFETYVGE